MAPCAVHFDAIGDGSSQTTDTVFEREFHTLKFEWDFGDGSVPVNGTADNLDEAYAIEAKHTYVGSDGEPFTATVSITDFNGVQSSDIYPIIIRPQTLEAEVNVAIDEG